MREQYGPETDGHPTDGGGGTTPDSDPYPTEMRPSDALQAIIDGQRATFWRLPGLEFVFHRFASRLEPSLARLLGTNALPSLEWISGHRYGDYIDGLARPIILGVFEVPDRGDRGMIQCHQVSRFARFWR